MSELYLIAHKVRGKPAFDVAEQMECPHCLEQGEQGCPECDGLGFWWIVSTSGHRAFPWWWLELKWDGTALELEHGGEEPAWWLITSMPESLPDHYITKAAPARPSSIEALLASKRKPSGPPIARRGF